ncbi:MAG: Acetate kinase [Burkholderiaceae bacterium]|nr:Acetate kinase [Burkholderiaceae bacterium]
MMHLEQAGEVAKRCYVVINAGSSSFKFSVFVEQDNGQLDRTVFGEVEGTRTKPHFYAKNRTYEKIDERCWEHEEPVDVLLAFLVSWIEEHLAPNRLVAIGHRMVHGGAYYQQALLVDEEAMTRLRTLVPLAPLHQPRVLAALDALLTRYPDLPQVICFDTAFHSDSPRISQLYGLPVSMSNEGLRRYGFHGSSYEYVSSRLPQVDPRAAVGRTIVAHLGSGASMCALVGGKSVASTMGFTALDGLVMGTRCGVIDPGLLLYLMQEKGMTPKEVETLLYQESGLFGVSGGISNDVRDLLASDEPAAKEALDLFVYRVVRETGSLAAAAGGLDAFVFTAGVGEHSPEMRARICAQLGWLGVELDEEANRLGKARISAPDSRVNVWIIPTNEELMIARHTAKLTAD